MTEINLIKLTELTESIHSLSIKVKTITESLEKEIDSFKHDLPLIASYLFNKER